MIICHQNYIVNLYLQLRDRAVTIGVGGQQNLDAEGATANEILMCEIEEKEADDPGSKSTFICIHLKSELLMCLNQDLSSTYQGGQSIVILKGASL